jgi:hypothetical protein
MNRTGRDGYGSCAAAAAAMTMVDSTSAINRASIQSSSFFQATG